MAGGGLFSWGLAPLALAAVTVLGAPSTVMMTPAFVVADAVLLDTEAWIMGGSGVPIPSPDLVQATAERYIDPATPFFPGQPVFPVDKANALFTPEGLYPVTQPTGVKTLPLDTSVAQGRQILDDMIHQQIGAGNGVVISGASQSATISSLEMTSLMDLPADQRPDTGQLSFVLLGDPSNPDGGLLSRFGDPSLPPLSIPSLGVTFTGATPDTPWDTAIYTQEYDGYADFPKYPINLLADLNALAGMGELHPNYASLTPDQMASAIPVDTSAGYPGHTTYWMIPTDHLPLLDYLRDVPVVGTPLADLLEPDLTVLVNLGYGPDPDIGWSTTGANVSTPFGLFPDFTTQHPFTAVLQALNTGAQDGFEAFVNDLSHPSLANVGADPAPMLDPQDAPSLVDIVNAFSGAASSAYAALLPTADIANALITTLPAYDAALFAQELTAGDLLDAVGLPIAATVGLGAVAFGFEVEVIMQAVNGVSDSLGALFS